jgi:putative sigma-54 modulation protein
MHTEIKGVHVNVTDQIRDYMEKKFQKLDYAKDLIVDLLTTLTKQKNTFKIESNINFRWGASAHISTDSFDVYEGIDTLIDKLEIKVKREKDKIKEH